MTGPADEGRRGFLRLAAAAAAAGSSASTRVSAITVAPWAPNTSASTSTSVIDSTLTKSSNKSRVRV